MSTIAPCDSSHRTRSNYRFTVDPDRDLDVISMDTDTTDVDVMVCADCMLWHANRDDSGTDDDFSPSGDFIIMGEPVDFYVPWKPCPSCGTTAAGTWVAAVSA